MREAIEKVLNDETLTTNDERVDAIAKDLATLVIPKDKYNELNTKLKNTENSYTTLSSEYEEYKKSKMTDEEKTKAEREAFEKQKIENAKMKSELAVKGMLLDNGIKINEDDVELKETLENIISEDYDKSIKLANNFISLLNKTKDQTAKQTTTDLLNNTPKPIGGVNSSSTVSKMDQLKEAYQKAIEAKDSILQTQLITEMYQEQQKQRNITM